MSGLKIHSIPSDKESWENVPPIVHKSFHVFSTNMTSIKRWTDKTDDKLKTIIEQHQHVESRLSATDDSLRETQVRLQELSAEYHAMEAQGKKEFHTFTSCIKQLLDGTLDFFARFVTSFGADAGLEALGQESAPEDGELDTLEHLQVLCSRLGVHLECIKDAFDIWGNWRSQSEEKGKTIQTWVEELHHAFESTRERLLTWREMLKESSYAVDSLSSALSATQNDVRRLQATQVRREDVEEAVDECAKELRELNSQTGERLDGVAMNLDKSTVDFEDSIKDMESRFDQLVFSRCNDLAQGVERQLNPINAYLNTMHVKADTLRVELDGVCEQLPKLMNCIDDVSTRLTVCDGEGKERSSELSGMVEDLKQGATEGREKGEADRISLTDSIQDLRHEFDDHVTDLRMGLDSAVQALESVKQEELSNVTRDLSNLEQKVARWVHATPLPAKMSEARLYSLEAKLAEEMESRLQLEETVKEERAKGLWMRSSDAGSLPSLGKRMPSAPPGSSQSARRSTRYSKGSISGPSGRPSSGLADGLEFSGTQIIAPQT
mmetsp:Transcript_128705/g.223206  ORF Transcript_128705/g.223206 Transcript_128705/m.223206 type:complete len:551 (+) Transcript_128705:96-1748(+)